MAGTLVLFAAACIAIFAGTFLLYWQWKEAAAAFFALLTTVWIVDWGLRRL